MEKRQPEFFIYIFVFFLALLLLSADAVLTAKPQQLPAPGKIEIRTVEPFVFCSLSRVGSFEEIESLIGELMQHMQNQNVFPTGGLIGIFYGDANLSDPEKIQWEMGFPINEQAQVLAPLEKKQWAFTTVAVSLHQGPYEQTGETILKIQEWLEENGYVQNGPILERYHDPDPSRVSGNDLRTEIWIPCSKR